MQKMMSLGGVLLFCVVMILFVSCQSGKTPGAVGTDGSLLGPEGIKEDYKNMVPPVGVSLIAGVGYKADQETLDKIKQSLERFAQLLCSDTYGNMYLKKAIVRNNSKESYIHFEKLAKLGGHARFGGTFTVNTNLLDLDKRTGQAGMGIRVLGAGIMHEFGHSMLLLKDEYGTKRKCVMHPQSRTTTFCPSCHEELLSRFTNWKFPVQAKRADWLKKNNVPEPVIIIK